MKILIIGLGSIARKHLAAIRQIEPEAEIYALRSSLNADLVPGIQNIYSWEDLKSKPDFILISNPTSLHEDSIIKSFKYQCPLFIEKPALNNPGNSKKIGEAIRSHKITTYVACNLRFHPAINFFKKYLKENPCIINEVNIYCGSYLPDWRPGKNFREQYSSQAELGGGVHLDLIHELDYCLWLFGKPLKINGLKRNSSSLKIDAVDFASYQLIYETFNTNITLNYFRRDSKRVMEVLTEHDTLLLDLLTCRITSLNKNQVLFEQTFEMKDTYFLQMQYFMDCIKGQQKPMNGFDEAVETLEMALC